MRQLYRVGGCGRNRIEGAELLPDQDVEDIINQNSPTSDRVPADRRQGWFRPETVTRLTLVLLNKCNIRCDYCYEDGGGTFGLSYARMSREVSFRSVDVIYENYKSIDFLMFFGGEPLLMAREFAPICDYIVEKCQALQVPAPKFGLITNAILVNERIVGILKKYDVTVTVSIDGPPEVHDHFRKTKSGQGSFSHSVKGYWKLKDAGIQTFIQSSLNDENIGDRPVPSIIKYFDEELDCASPHVTVVGSDRDSGVKPKVRDGLPSPPRTEMIRNNLRARG